MFCKMPSQKTPHTHIPDPCMGAGLWGTLLGQVLGLQCVPSFECTHSQAVTCVCVCHDSYIIPAAGGPGFTVNVSSRRWVAQSSAV